MMTFLDLKNAFGSVSHQLIFDMWKAVRVPSAFFHYIHSVILLPTICDYITSKVWETDAIPFRHGVFQGDTLSPIMILLVFNPILKLAESLNQSCGYKFQLPAKGTDMLPPVETTVYVKWTEEGDEVHTWLVQS